MMDTSLSMSGKNLALAAVAADETYFESGVDGGTGPYTYLWVNNSGDAITPGSPTSQATIFSYNSTPIDTRIATFYCRVTDSLSNAANSGLVTVEIDFL